MGLILHEEGTKIGQRAGFDRVLSLFIDLE